MIHIRCSFYPFKELYGFACIAVCDVITGSCIKHGYVYPLKYFVLQSSVWSFEAPLRFCYFSLGNLYWKSYDLLFILHLYEGMWKMKVSVKILLDFTLDHLLCQDVNTGRSLFCWLHCQKIYLCLYHMCTDCFNIYIFVKNFFSINVWIMTHSISRKYI